jgi:hypothetical protein
VTQILAAHEDPIRVDRVTRPWSLQRSKTDLAPKQMRSVLTSTTDM